jgi:hypothetical protein
VLSSSFPPANCEQRKELMRAPSPDGAWVASFYYNVCSDGGFVTSYSDTVELARPNDPPTPGPTRGLVFGMDHDRDDVPRGLTWTAPRRLAITIPNEAWIGGQNTSYRDVTIFYTYVPDDPVERACRNEWLSIPVVERDHRSQTPGERESFFAHCRSVLDNVSIR